MGGMPLRTFLETQHDYTDVVDMVMERAALLPPLDEPPKAKPPTQAQLRKAGKEGRLRMTIQGEAAYPGATAKGRQGRPAAHDDRDAGHGNDGYAVKKHLAGRGVVTDLEPMPALIEKG
jgi:hypothetical protein